MHEPQPSRDLDAWLDALAGRREAADDAAVGTDVAEGRLLREALRRWPAAEPPPDAAADRARWTALLAAAHADRRLSARRGCFGCQAIAGWFSWRRLGGATALAAAAWMTFALVPWQPEAPGPAAPDLAGALRGPAAEGVQRLRAADPRALRDRMVEELAQVGVAATPYERLGRFGFDAELPPVRSDRLVRLLHHRALAVPASGGLAVEIEALQ